jgi:hypothetical protein
VSVHADDLRVLIHDLGQASAGVLDQVEKVASKGALNIKKDWRDRWSGHSHIPRLPYAVGYDVERSEDTVRAEIGPDKDMPQGPLGNLIEFGSVHNAPIPGGLPALDAEEPRFARALENLGEQLLEGR